MATFWQVSQYEYECYWVSVQLSYAGDQLLKCYVTMNVLGNIYMFESMLNKLDSAVRYVCWYGSNMQTRFGIKYAKQRSANAVQQESCACRVNELSYL